MKLEPTKQVPFRAEDILRGDKRLLMEYLRKLVMWLTETYESIARVVNYNEMASVVPCLCAHNITHEPSDNGILTGYDTVSLNTGGGTFSSGEYTVPATGVYSVSFSIYCLMDPDSSVGYFYIAHNGTATDAVTFVGVDPTSPYQQARASSISSLIQCVSGDKLAIMIDNFGEMPWQSYYTLSIHKVSN